MNIRLAIAGGVVALAGVIYLIWPKEETGEGDTNMRDPVPRPVPGRVTSPFGQRIDPVTGKKSEFHNGVDFSAAIGTDIVAPLDGDVIRTWSDELNGMAMRVKCGPYTFGFAHLSNVALNVGDKFLAGETLAQTGNSGHTTGPHLHASVWDGSALLDPALIGWS